LGSESTGKVLGAKVPLEVYTAFEELAAAEDLTVSSLLLTVIRNYLKTGGRLKTMSEPIDYDRLASKISEAKKSLLECPECGTVTNSPEGFYRHIQREHPSGLTDKDVVEHVATCKDCASGICINGRCIEMFDKLGYSLKKKKQYEEEEDNRSLRDKIWGDEDDD
jgi:hypothetical protein